MKRRTAILDVFTDTPLEGNPVAIVLDADGLDGERMQAIAREFNLSETVFVLPAENPVHSLRARIFTPVYELPFAGHPTVGTAVLHALMKAREGATQNERVVLIEEQVGPVRCGVFLKDERSAHAMFDLPKLPERVEDNVPSREAVAGALGLTLGEIGFENHVPTRFQAGVGYTFVPVRDVEALASVQVNHAQWAKVFGTGNESHPAAYVYTRVLAPSDRDFRARMFVPGIGEDPATGSAVAGFAGVVRLFDALRPGSHRMVIEQGVEMGRPSRIILEIDMAGSEIDAARIGGDAVLVGEGTLDA